MDRLQTILLEYVPCEQCQAEANQSRDRRFLYPLNVCATCGPRLTLQDAGGRPRFHHREALIQAAACLDRGQVLVVEEPHGYQLVAIARSSSAIKRIRSILGQPHQPAMLLVATPDAADTFCDMHPQERAWMQAPAPTVPLPSRCMCWRRAAQSQARRPAHSRPRVSARRSRRTRSRRDKRGTHRNTHHAPSPDGRTAVTVSR